MLAVLLVEVYEARTLLFSIRLSANHQTSAIVVLGVQLANCSVFWVYRQGFR